MRAYINNKPFDFDQEITILEAATLPHQASPVLGKQL